MNNLTIEAAGEYNGYIAMGLTFVGSFIAIPILLGIARLFALYVIVRERHCVVFELFGKVRLVLHNPGIYCPWISSMGPLAALVPFLGKKYTVDMRLDQTYLRSQPVNSEEGAPMGIGIWCEMMVSDPLSYLLQKHRSSGIPACQHLQCHCALSEQPQARGHAGESPLHEPSGTRRGLGEIQGMGLRSGQHLCA